MHKYSGDHPIIYSSTHSLHPQEHLVGILCIIIVAVGGLMCWLDQYCRLKTTLFPNIIFDFTGLFQFPLSNMKG